MVELNPKSDMARGDVAFHTTDKSKYFVSWGPLQEAQNKFKTLKEHRDYSLSRLKSRDVDSLSVIKSLETTFRGHPAIFTSVSLILRTGMLGRNLVQRIICSIHLYCDNVHRYYVIYMISNWGESDADRISDYFDRVLKTFKCHR